MSVTEQSVSHWGFVKAGVLLFCLPPQFSELNAIYCLHTFFSHSSQKLPCCICTGSYEHVLLLSSIEWDRCTWMIYKQTKWKVFAQRSLQSSAWMLQLLSRGWDCCVHVLSTWKLWLKALILQSALLVRNRFRPQSCSRLCWLGAQCLHRVWQQASPADRAMQRGLSLLRSAFFFLFFPQRKRCKFSHSMYCADLRGEADVFTRSAIFRQNTVTHVLCCWWCSPCSGKILVPSCRSSTQVRKQAMFYNPLHK